MTDERSSATEKALSPNVADYVASAAKSIVGAVPFAGSLLVEIAGTVIPNQRLDRIARFAEELDRRLTALEAEFVRSQLSNEHFTDLIEESLRQAARAVSQERLEYISHLVSTSLSDENVTYVESKHVLRLLSELNDIEVIRLGAYQYRSAGSGQEYRDRHATVLEPVRAYIGSPQEDVDKATLQDSYREHLLQLGLIEARYEVDSSLNIPVVDRHTGGLKVRMYQLSPLGDLMLRHIGIRDSRAG